MTKIVAVDIETTGLDPWRDKITCIGVYRPEKSGVLRDECLDSVANIKDAVVGHNFKFDQKFLTAAGYPVDSWEHCTQLMAHICTDKVPDSYLEWYEALRQEENKKLPHGVTHRQAGRLSLKVLAPYFLGVEPFWEDPSNHDNDAYVLKDCKYTYDLFVFFKAKLEEQGSWEFYRKVFNWNKMLFRMEMRGIELNLEQLDAVKAEYEDLKETYYSELQRIWKTQINEYAELSYAVLDEKYSQMLDAAILKAKTEEAKQKATVRYTALKSAAKAKVEPLNLASSAQMQWLLGERLKYNIIGDEQKPSTKKSVLNRLSKEGKEDVKTYLKWRDAEKVLTMYLPTYRELQVDGVIHPTFNPTGTRTGRLSSSEPNMQQVPSKLYKLFKPRNGKVFGQHDLAGIEAALIALYSNDKNLFEILQKGESIHDHNSITFFGLKCNPAEVAEKYAKERRTSKTIGFALFYGAGFRRIKEAFLQNGYMISDKEAKNKLAAFKEYYSGAAQFHAEVSELFEAGETVHNLFGRPIKIQPWENAFMNGFNTLIQSSASDLNIRACEKAESEWIKQGLDAAPLLLVHDFILAEYSEQDAEKADKILVDAMTNFKLTNDHGTIQLRVDGGIGHEWKK